MTTKTIRPLALGLFRKDNQILLFEGSDPITRQVFFRPLGGTIKFGEYGHQALARELREELGAEVANLCYLGLIQNIFTHHEQIGHEIVLLYEGDLADSALYGKERMIGQEDDGSLINVVWKSLEFFRRGEAPLYPSGLLELLLGEQSTEEVPCV